MLRALAGAVFTVVVLASGSSASAQPPVPSPRAAAAATPLDGGTAGPAREARPPAAEHRFDPGPGMVPRNTWLDEEHLAVAGALEKKLVGQIITRNLNQIRYCYELHLVRTPKLACEATLEFVIAPDGTVQSAQVVESSNDCASSMADPGAPSLGQCLARRVSTWQFPRPRSGSVKVTSPFVFKAL